MRVAVLLVLAGCWSSSDAVPEQRLPPLVEREPVPPPMRRPAHSVWKGHYVCAQGRTALTLSLDHDGPTLSGVFDFGPLDENPTVPHGSYRMTGTATTSGGGAVVVKLAPLEWIEHPNNYVMVGIEATTDRERRELSGVITHATCGEVELSRVE